MSPSETEIPVFMMPKADDADKNYPLPQMKKIQMLKVVRDGLLLLLSKWSDESVKQTGSTRHYLFIFIFLNFCFRRKVSLEMKLINN